MIIWRENGQNYPLHFNVEILDSNSYPGHTMPLKSQAQRKWMHANKPGMAAQWEKETPKGKKLPKKVSKPTRKKTTK